MHAQMGMMDGYGYVFMQDCHEEDYWLLTVSLKFFC